MQRPVPIRVNFLKDPLLTCIGFLGQCSNNSIRIYAIRSILYLYVFRRPLDSSAGNLKSKGSLHLIRAPEPRLRYNWSSLFLSVFLSLHAHCLFVTDGDNSVN